MGRFLMWLAGIIRRMKDDQAKQEFAVADLFFDKEHTHEEIIALLTNPDTSTDDKTCAILALEEIALSDEQKLQVKPHLYNFIMRNREVASRYVLVTLGSAIRKLVSIIPFEELGSIIDIINPDTSEDGIALDVEMEIAKAIVQKCVYAQLPITYDDPKVEDGLWDLVHAYTNLRLLTRDVCGCVALEAFIGLVLLRSKYIDVAIRQVLDTGTHWFIGLLAHRLVDIAYDSRWTPAPEIMQTIIATAQKICPDDATKRIKQYESQKH